MFLVILSEWLISEIFTKCNPIYLHSHMFITWGSFNFSVADPDDVRSEGNKGEDCIYNSKRSWCDHWRWEACVRLAPLTRQYLQTHGTSMECCSCPESIISSTQSWGFFLPTCILFGLSYLFIFFFFNDVLS